MWLQRLQAPRNSLRQHALLRHQSTAVNARVAVENKWQQRWAQQALVVKPQDTKPKFYCLAMFPYPSGKLHIGHVRVYTISDCIARLKRMQGFQVMHPMGWDAFGLPAENAAIERGITPAEWTISNIAQFKEQMTSLGIQFDWDRELATCTPEYYKWTQWIFLKLFEEGLAYRKEALVNWDPVDRTVLANEQVDADGISWRSGAKVEQRSLNQWFLRITDYGDRLLDDLDKLHKWPEAVKRMQASWIGRSTGSEVEFKVYGAESSGPVNVFTTRVDTLFGVSFVSVAPEGNVAALLELLIPESHRQSVRSYLASVKAIPKELRNKSDSTGGVFSGLYATHPLTGAKVPIYFAEYVLPEYGTGAVMGVPAHDERDFAFAQRHELKIVPVIESSDSNTDEGGCVTGYGTLCNSKEYSGKTSEEAQAAINHRLGFEGVGGAVTQFRLRDWLVSRQRYWGTPVPVIHCKSCGPVGVPFEDLPVPLPPMSESVADDLRGGDGESPLARMHEWKKCKCPDCGGDAERDTDTLDTFVDSSWYFMRYCDATNNGEVFSPKSVEKWMQPSGVDLYVGGIEHAILHLLYSRFLTKFLYDQKLLPTDEPFAQLLAQGMVLGRTHKSSSSLRCLQPSEYTTDTDGRTVETATRKEVITVWEKMSKSKFNGVDPEHIRTKYGADVARLVVLFKAPPTHELEWDEADLAGQTRWLNRISTLLENASEPSNDTDVTPEMERELRLQLHGTIKRVTEALDHNQSFNVAIAELMKLSNFLGDVKHLQATAVYKEALESLIKMLAPLAPHAASELFERFQTSTQKDNNEMVDVHDCAWPKYDPSVLATAQVKIVLQVQGKVRDTIFVPSEIQNDKDKVLELAMASPAIQRHLGSKTVRKVILVSPKSVGAHGALNIVAA